MAATEVMNLHLGPTAFARRASTMANGKQARAATAIYQASSSASDAVLSAIADVQRAIPGARLVEAAPDYVGLTDVAELLGMSRQNMRKLMTSHPDFPCPVHEGSSQVWHLESVLRWLGGPGGAYRIEQRLVEIAEITMQCNLTKEASRLEPARHSRIRELVAT